MNLYGRTGMRWLDGLLSDGSHLCGMMRGCVTLTCHYDSNVHVLALYGHPLRTGTREQLWPVFKEYDIDVR